MGKHVDYFVVRHPKFLNDMLQEPCKWQRFIMLSCCWNYPHRQPTSNFVLTCVQIWAHLAIQKFACVIKLHLRQALLCFKQLTPCCCRGEAVVAGTKVIRDWDL